MASLLTNIHKRRLESQAVFASFLVAFSFYLVPAGMAETPPGGMMPPSGGGMMPPSGGDNGEIGRAHV